MWLRLAEYTSVNAGTTTINISEVTLEGGRARNYTVTLPDGSLTVAGITQANPVLTWPAGLTATYGQTLADVTLNGTSSTPGTFTWTALGTTLVGDAGQQTHNMTFTPTDTVNFNVLTNDVTITVEKAQGAVVTALEVTATTNSVTITEAALAGGTGQTMEFAFNTTGISPATGWADLDIPQTISGLTAGTRYHVFVRAVESANYLAGTVESKSIWTLSDSALAITFTPIVDPVANELKLPDGFDINALEVVVPGNTEIELTINLTVDGDHFEWFVNGQPRGGNTNTFVLRSGDFRHTDVGARHFLTVEVEIGGIPYGLTIPFTVVAPTGPTN